MHYCIPGNHILHFFPHVPRGQGYTPLPHLDAISADFRNGNAPVRISKFIYPLYEPYVNLPMDDYWFGNLLGVLYCNANCRYQALPRRTYDGGFLAHLLADAAAVDNRRHRLVRPIQDSDGSTIHCSRNIIADGLHLRRAVPAPQRPVPRTYSIPFSVRLIRWRRASTSRTLTFKCWCRCTTSLGSLTRRFAIWLMCTSPS